jgi:tripartite-type tricarboxylate transporter receptor subunit TctC
MPSAGERCRVSPPQHAKSNRGRAPRPGRSSGIGKQLTLGFALALGSTAITWAQAYPSRAITLVVPFGAGGPADTIGRIVAEGMGASLGQPVIVENVAGASGTIGVAVSRRPTATPPC